MVTTNALANIIPFNNQTTAEVSDKYATYFTPAGYVFAIWIVIYVLLGAFTLYQARAEQKDDKALSKGAYLLSFANIINGMWIFTWHFELLELSIVLMVLLLLLLIATYLSLCQSDQKVTRARKLWVNLPISVYLGWISVATVANAASVLQFYNWEGFGISPVMWSVISIIVVTIVTFVVLVTTSDWVFAAVVVWAFIGLRYNFSDVLAISWATLVASIFIVMSAFIASQSRGRVSNSQSSV